MKFLTNYFKKQEKKMGVKSLDFMMNKLRYFSVTVAEACNALGISPNFVTVSRFFIFGCGSATFFFIGGYQYNLLGLSLLFLNFFFDLVDGDLARNFNKKTKLGGILDGYLDAVLINLILISISLNLFFSENPLRYFSLLAISGQALSAEVARIYQDRFGISCIAILPEIELMLKKNKVDLASNILIELLSPRYIFSSIFSTVRYYLIVGILFGLLPLAMAVYSIAINFRWITLFIALCVYYSTKSEKKNYLFKTLETIENNRRLLE